MFLLTAEGDIFYLENFGRKLRKVNKMIDQIQEKSLKLRGMEKNPKTQFIPPSSPGEGLGTEPVFKLI